MEATARRRIPRVAVCLCGVGLIAATEHQGEAQTTHGGDRQGTVYQDSNAGRWRDATPQVGSNPYRALPWNERRHNTQSDVRIQNDPFASRARARADWRSGEGERPDFQQFNTARERQGFDRMDWDVPDRRFDDQPPSGGVENRWSSAYRGQSGDRFTPDHREEFNTGRGADWSTGRRTGDFEAERWDNDGTLGGRRRFGEAGGVERWESDSQNRGSGRAEWDSRTRFDDFDGQSRFGQAGRRTDEFSDDFRGDDRTGGFYDGRRSLTGQAAAQFGSRDFGPRDAGPGRRGFGPSGMGRAAVDGGHRGGIGRSGVNPSGLNGGSFGRSGTGSGFGFDAGAGGGFAPDTGGFGQSGFGGRGSDTGFGSGSAGSGLRGTGSGSGIGSSPGFGDGGIGGPGLGGSGGSGIGGLGAGGGGGTGGR